MAPMVRRIVGTPGWHRRPRLSGKLHRHYRRLSATALFSVLCGQTVGYSYCHADEPLGKCGSCESSTARSTFEQGFVRESTRLANGTNYRADEPLVTSVMHLYHADEPRVTFKLSCTTMDTWYLFAECLGPIGECTTIISYILQGKVIY